MLTAQDLPTLRTAPPEIVAALKEVDPTAELVYFGDGRWDLLRLRPKTDARMRSVNAMLRTAAEACAQRRLGERGWYRNLRLARLLRLGYVVFGRWRLAHDPDHRIVHAFRRAMWEYHHDRNDQLIAQRWSAREARADALRREFGDPARAREASRALRHPVTFTVPGLRTPA